MKRSMFNDFNCYLFIARFVQTTNKQGECQILIHKNVDKDEGLGNKAPAEKFNGFDKVMLTLFTTKVDRLFNPHRHH